MHTIACTQSSLIEKLEVLYAKEEFENLIEISKSFIQSPDFQSIDCQSKGQVAHLLGKTYYNLDLENEAISWFKKAVFEFWEGCKDVQQSEIINTVYNIGIAYQYTSQPFMGKTYIDSALITINQMEDYPKDQLAYKFQGAGNYYSLMEDFSKSENYLQNAINQSSDVELIDAYYMHIDLLSLYSRFRNFEKAKILLKEIDQRFGLYLSGFSPFDHALYLLNSAEILLIDHQLDQARIRCLETIKLLGQEDTDLLSNAYEILGQIAFREDQLDLSQDYFSKALTLRRVEEDILRANEAQSFAYENLAEVAFAKKELARSTKLIQEAIMKISSLRKEDANGLPMVGRFEYGDEFDLSRQLAIQAKILSEYDDVDSLGKAIVIHQKIDSLVENLVSFAFLDEAKLALLDTKQRHQEQAIAICEKLYRTTHDIEWLYRAFHFSIDSKAMVLRTLSERNKRLTFDIPDTLVQAVEHSRAKLIELKRSISEHDGDLVALSERLSQAELQHERLLDRIKSEFSLERDQQLISVENIRSNLDRKTMFLDAFTGEKTTYLFAITKNNLSFTRIINEELIPMVDSLIVQMKDPSVKYDVGLAQKVYLQFFNGDVMDDVKEVSAIIFSPDGFLRRLPLEALVDESGQYVLENMNVSYSLLPYRTKNSGSRTYERDFVGFATNYSEDFHRKMERLNLGLEAGNLSNLLFSDEELKRSSSFFSPDTFINEKATLENYSSKARNARIIYLSLHGIADQENGSNSVLIFDDRNQRFLLRGYEIQQDYLGSELVVLSACYTADGSLHQGEGINGLTRSFLAAGVQNVLSSHWSATEEASLAILPNFFQKVKNQQGKSEAMQGAKLDYLQAQPPSLQHPYYWANYVLFTDLSEKRGSGIVWEFKLLLGLLILIVIFMIIRYRHKLRHAVSSSLK